MKAFALGAVIVTALSGSAQASILLKLDSVTPERFPKISSTIILGTSRRTKAYEREPTLVIVDFAGYVTGSAVTPSPDISVSVSNTLPAGLTLKSGLSDA